MNYLQTRGRMKKNKSRKQTRFCLLKNVGCKLSEQVWSAASRLNCSGNKSVYQRAEIARDAKLVCDFNNFHREVFVFARLFILYFKRDDKVCAGN